MHIIIKRFHCFFICSCENQKFKSDKNERQIVLKERIKENNLGLQVSGLTDRFTRNESIVNMGKKNINIQKFFFIQGSYFILTCFFTTVTSLKGFLFRKNRTDEHISGDARGIIRNGSKELFFLHLTSFICI